MNINSLKTTLELLPKEVAKVLNINLGEVYTLNKLGVLKSRRRRLYYKGIKDTDRREYLLITQESIEKFKIFVRGESAQNNTDIVLPEPMTIKDVVDVDTLILAFPQKQEQLNSLLNVSLKECLVSLIREV